MTQLSRCAKRNVSAVIIVMFVAVLWNSQAIGAPGRDRYLLLDSRIIDTTDNAKSGQLAHGAIGLHIHDKGMQVEFKDILLKRLETI